MLRSARSLKEAGIAPTKRLLLKFLLPKQSAIRAGTRQATCEQEHKEINTLTAIEAAARHPLITELTPDSLLGQISEPTTTLLARCEVSGCEIRRGSHAKLNWEVTYTAKMVQAPARESNSQVIPLQVCTEGTHGSPFHPNRDGSCKLCFISWSVHTAITMIAISTFSK